MVYLTTDEPTDSPQIAGCASCLSGYLIRQRDLRGHGAARLPCLEPILKVQTCTPVDLSRSVRTVAPGIRASVRAQPTLPLLRAACARAGVVADGGGPSGSNSTRVETWKLSTDPQFVDKERDVVGLYLDPPENALMLACDEKSQMQAISRTAPILLVMPTTPARMTHDYVRHGTTKCSPPSMSAADRSSLTTAAGTATGSSCASSADRRRRVERPGPGPGAGQLRHPQNPRGEDLAYPPPVSTCTSPPPAAPG